MRCPGCPLYTRAGHPIPNSSHPISQAPCFEPRNTIENVNMIESGLLRIPSTGEVEGHINTICERRLACLGGCQRETEKTKEIKVLASS